MWYRHHHYHHRHQHSWAFGVYIRVRIGSASGMHRVRIGYASEMRRDTDRVREGFGARPCSGLYYLYVISYYVRYYSMAYYIITSEHVGGVVVGGVVVDLMMLSVSAVFRFAVSLIWHYACFITSPAFRVADLATNIVLASMLCSLSRATLIGSCSDA